ncbi:MAG TPA: GHKL domain-containing protein [Thiotrichaceae bacterium]|nr:GHKL domain-containing protein [Thiotrichaceae bacterium]
MYNTLEELKTALQQELSKEQFNFERISELNERLLALDPQATRFTVDAQHIHRLGFELVGKQETALSELIKNAYDADATYISIDFKDYDKAGGTLIIRDDGNGMTSLDIRDNWMRLSTSDKEKNPISPRYGRSRAGRKGIGRFAVERLGKQLLLETKKKDETKLIRVYFDWENQYQSGKLLTQITNLIEQVIAEQNTHGTTLNIGKLRDKWTKNDFIQIWKYVLFLQPPFEIPLRHRASQNDSETYAPDPGFKVRINSQLRNEAVPEFSLEKRFLANRTALIKGWIDTEGKGYFQVHSEILEFEVKQDSEDNYQDVGPLEFEVSYFIYDSKLISKVNEARKFGKQLGGIRIYRDGFRVLPYGESNNDWLQLVIGERNRLLNAKNENFFGHVALTSAENPTLEETASREGLVENEAYKKLCDFINECLEWAVLRVASYRHRQLDIKQYEPIPENRQPSMQLQRLIDELPKKLEKLPVETQQEIISEIKQVKKEQSRQEAQRESERQQEIKYAEMLRVLASLGISIAVFSHETGAAVTRLKASLMNLQSLTLSACQNSTEINEHFGQVEQTTNDLGELANYINAQIDSSVKRNKDNIALYAVIQTFIKQFQNYLNTWKIAFEWDVTPNYLRTALMHYSEINAVLFNFLTNAIKAMERSNAEQRRIKVTATKQGNFAIIRFQDTGAGVADNIKNRIFDAFFTTSAQNRKDEIAGPGCGLGLKIVSDIAKVNKGFVRLSEPDTGYGCCFEFGVPISSKQLKLSEV